VTIAAPRVLFVSHEASRTGAPIFLLELLTWIRRNTDIRATTLVLRDGPLTPLFGAVSDVEVLRTSLTRTTIESGLSRVNADVTQRVFRRRIRRGVRHLDHHDLVYLNSIVSARVLPVLDPATPVIAHIHELERGQRAIPGLDDHALLVRRANRFIAVSEGVRKTIEARNAMARIDVVPGFIDATAVTASMSDDTADDSASLRLSFGLPESGQVVLGVGQATWRKGIDLFLQLALAVRSRIDLPNPPTFVWVGDTDGPAGVDAAWDHARAGLTDAVKFVGIQSDMSRWYKVADLIALTSREDPFPLTVLEAAAYGRPTVCFRDAGGAPEFTRNDAGVAIPYLDVPAMAREVASLLSDANRRRQLGAAAAQRATTEYDVSVRAPQFVRIIEDVLRETQTRH
jgi:glycosyltransferase involved in cell wall biosynthesis